jgi:cardiolipin synthase
MPKDVFSPESYLPGHTVALVAGGEDFFVRLIGLIDNARKLIHFQMYIFDPDETGREVAEALKKAARRGVDIFLAVDSYGSRSLTPAFIAGLEESGIRFKLFSPLPEHFYFFRLGRRLHNKVVVADGASALVGGINIADKYRGSETQPPWLDFAVAVEGPACAGLSHICDRIFREKYFGRSRALPALNTRTEGQVRCRVAVNDWYRQKNQIGAGYLAACRRANHSIQIMASYFLPNRALRTALIKAARRGVRVSVLLPGESDLPVAKRAIRYLYGELLRNDIEVYEWGSSILHGKLAVADDRWVTVGSYNLNHLSQYSSIEMNVEVLDEPFAIAVRDAFFSLTGQSDRISPARVGPSLSLTDQALDWASYTLARWSMLLLYFFIRREYRYREKGW